MAAASASASASATTLPFLLISLLILFIYCSHIISCFAIAITTTHEGQVPSSVTPKAAAVHYWHLKTGNNKPLPPVILSKLSPLSPTDMIVTNDEATRANGGKVKMGKIDAPQDRHPTASDDGGENFLIYGNYDPQQDHHATVGDMMHAKSATASDDGGENFLIYGNYDPNNNIKMVTGDVIKEKAAKQISPRLRGIFFRESELKEGKTIPLLKFAGMSSGQYFLPRSIASKIPFSANATSKIFHIPTDSALYRDMESTIGQCRMPPNKGETKQCITSAEDMIDYALSSLGANADIQVWSTNNSRGFEGKGLIGKVKLVYDGELTGKQHLTCHQVIFPYLVFHCHSVHNTRLYDIEILDAETKENINRVAAVCHLDTKGWDPKHGSFAVLASAPGMTEVCHWMPPCDMTLTASDAAAATATVAE